MASRNPKQLVVPLYLATPPPSPLPTPPPYFYDPHDKQIFIVSGLVVLVIISSICMICITNRTSHDHHQNTADAPTRDGERYDTSRERTSGSWYGGSRPNCNNYDKEQMMTTVTVERQAAAAEECAVCLEGMKEGDECGVVKRCDHRYHKPCIDRWLLHSDRCPLCRLHIWTTRDNDHLITRAATSRQLDVI